MPIVTCPEPEMPMTPPASDIPTMEEIDAEINAWFERLSPSVVAAYCVACGRPSDTGLCSRCLATPGAW